MATYMHMTIVCFIFSSLKPLGQSQLTSAFRHRPQSSNICFESAWPINTKFHVEPPWEGGNKIYINGPGHMTKMAVMSIYGKNLLQAQKSYDLETWHAASGTTKFI